MVKVEIIPSTPGHAAHIAANIRPEDKSEIWASALHTPEKALELGLSLSDYCLTGTVDDRPVCIWGVVTESMITNHGVPWMVASKDVDRHAKAFLRRNQPEVVAMLERYDTLENYVDARNKRAINWLKWLGFTVEEPRPYGVLKLDFHRFWMRRADHV